MTQEERIAHQLMQEQTGNYLLRGIPQDTWRQFKARASLEGRTARETLLAFIQDYADYAPFHNTPKP